MTNPSRNEIASADELEKHIAAVPTGLVTFDGCPNAGKTRLASEMGRALGYRVLDLDAYLNQQQHEFFNALRLSELVRDIDSALAHSPVVLASGVCMQHVLDSIGRAASLRVYVQRNSSMGIPGDLDIIDVEEGIPASPDVLALFDEVEVEVYAYHERYRPKAHADILYVHTRD